MRFLDNFKKDKLIIAHRGFKSFYVENSLEALIKSSLDSDFIEFDIQFTKDYIPIIHHDETLKRMSNIQDIKKFKAYKPWFIKDFNFSEIQDLNIKGTKLSTLSEFLNIAREKNIFFNLEIKKLPKNINKIKAIDIIIQKIEYYNCSKLVLFSSFKHEYLEIINNYKKDYAIGVLDENTKRENLVGYLKKLNAQTYNINKELINEKQIKKLKKEKIETFVYTINNKKSIDKVLKKGVKGVFTDYPYKLFKD
ncbi:glycerophosphodiester phosphodiesterase [Arcobacter sp. YIC-310]|uniref:glycerophosphodiester phosphodiesterase n=1 Tax=Arcobacter sp. YIC-310 TaxID=3376632 RepID=UPI003C26695A